MCVEVILDERTRVAILHQVHVRRPRRLLLGVVLHVRVEQVLDGLQKLRSLFQSALDASRSVLRGFHGVRQPPCGSASSAGGVAAGALSRVCASWVAGGIGVRAHRAKTASKALKAAEVRQRPRRAASHVSEDHELPPGDEFEDQKRGDADAGEHERHRGLLLG